MKKRMFAILALVCLIVPQIGADEKSDAEAMIAQAKTSVDKLNTLWCCPGPALSMRMAAENQLKLANEAFGTEKYGEAKQYAQTALEYANKALGLRAFCYMYKHRVVPPPPTRQPAN